MIIFFQKRRIFKINVVIVLIEDNLKIKIQMLLLRKISLDCKKGGEMEEKINGNSCLNILYF
ncbi:MAG TPA: hypothetical protein DHW70_01610 [Candidatus Atribacteria bacterium]|nr:hypothetical protein [Candidatus Atribacteria bacterium]